MYTKFLTVIDISEIKHTAIDRSPNKYKTVKFSTQDKIKVKNEITDADVLVKIKPKTTVINIYEKSYITGEYTFEYNIKIGDLLLGDIVTRQVKPYKIPYYDFINECNSFRTVETYTTVVFGDCNSPIWNKVVDDVFKSHGHITIKETNKESEKFNFSLAEDMSYYTETSAISK